MFAKYSNGWGHLIMSVLMTIIAFFLIVLPVTDASTKGVGFGILGTVIAAWFVPNAAKQQQTKEKEKEICQ